MLRERWARLDVWKDADDLAFAIYQITDGFPKQEQYGITSQLRRAALSVPCNIVEGYAKGGDRELSRFLNISLGSLAEVRYLLHFSRRLGILADDDYERAEDQCGGVGQRLWNFYQKVRAST